MKKGEKAIVVSDPEYSALGKSELLYPYNCPNDSKSIFIIELLDFYDKEKGKWDYTE